MAKEVAISKRLKISEAQQYMLLSVLGASIVLGIAISLISFFAQQISYNAQVIMAEDESIVAYSSVIKNTGVCKSPSGEVYSDAELQNCYPDSIEISEIQGTLRANILENLAANEALNSVPKEDDSSCINPETNKNYTYKQLMKKYNGATSTEEKVAASQLIKSCSALRVIPDALPAFKNEEALLASLNKLFKVSGWEPESISPSGDSEVSALAENLNAISVNLSVEADSGTTMRVLSNIERSIREFNVSRATFEWSSNNTLLFQAAATAYYVNESSIKEITKTINADGKMTTTSPDAEEVE